MAYGRTNQAILANKIKIYYQKFCQGEICIREYKEADKVGRASFIVSGSSFVSPTILHKNIFKFLSEKYRILRIIGNEEKGGG